MVSLAFPAFLVLLAFLALLAFLVFSASLVFSVLTVPEAVEQLMPGFVEPVEQVSVEDPEDVQVRLVLSVVLV